MVSGPETAKTLGYSARRRAGVRIPPKPSTKGSHLMFPALRSVNQSGVSEMKIIGKLICAMRGHKRGRNFRPVLAEEGRAYFKCPRCGATWSRKPRKIVIPITGGV